MSLSTFSISLDVSLQGIMCRNLFVIPSLQTMSYAADRSMNAAEVVSFFKQALTYVVSAST